MLIKRSVWAVGVVVLDVFLQHRREVAWSGEAAGEVGLGVGRVGVLCWRLLRQTRRGRRSGRPTGLGLLALGAVVGGAAVAAGAVIAVVAAVDELTDVILGWPGLPPTDGLTELHGRAAAAAVGGPARGASRKGGRRHGRRDLVETRAFPDGVVLTRYDTKR